MVMEPQLCTDHCSGRWEFDFEKDRQGFLPAGVDILEGSRLISGHAKDYEEGKTVRGWADAVAQEEGTADRMIREGFLEERIFKASKGSALLLAHGSCFVIVPYF